MDGEGNKQERDIMKKVIFADLPNLLSGSLTVHTVCQGPKRAVLLSFAADANANVVLMY